VVAPATGGIIRAGSVNVGARNSRNNMRRLAARYYRECEWPLPARNTGLRATARGTSELTKSCASVQFDWIIRRDIGRECEKGWMLCDPKSPASAKIARFDWSEEVNVNLSSRYIDF